MSDADDYGEGGGSKFVRKSQENPAFPIGIAGLCGVLAYGAYKYKHRGTMSTSIYLIQLRVAAQGTVVGCLCLGLVVQLSQKLMVKWQEKKD